IRPLHAQTLQAQQYNRESPTTRAAKVQGSSQLIERTPDMIRKYPTESVALFFCTQGDSFYSDEQGTHVLQAGQLLACNADSPFIRGFGVGVSEFVLTVSMDEFTKISAGKPLKQAHTFTFGRSPGDSSASGAAQRLAQWVADSLNAAGQSPERPESSVLSYLEALFQGACPDSGQLFEQAQRFIEVHCTHPELRRSDIAHLLHTSERQVARLFAAHDTSFSQELLQQRVYAAKQLLNAEPHTPVAEVARRCGFRSTPHFSRTFRQIIGFSATEARRQQAPPRVVLFACIEFCGSFVMICFTRAFSGCRSHSGIEFFLIALFTGDQPPDQHDQ